MFSARLATLYRKRQRHRSLAALADASNPGYLSGLLIAPQGLACYDFSRLARES